MTHYDTLTRMWYCPSCCHNLHFRQGPSAEGGAITMECRNTRCWQDVVGVVTPVQWSLLSEREQDELQAQLARCERAGEKR